MIRQSETANLWLLLLFATGFFFFSLCLGGDLPAADSKTEEPAGIAKGQTKQGYGYMSGGVGSEEREAMAKEAGAYNVKISFATTSGQ